VKVDGCSECLISIQNTNKQLSDALVVLGKQITRKCVSAPKKKKKGMALSGPVNIASGPLPCAAPQNPSAPRTQSPPH